MRKNLINIGLSVILFTGLALLLYPSVSDYWNSLHQTQAITTYTEDVAKLDTVTYDRQWADAFAYNEEWKAKEDRDLVTEEEQERYQELLNITGNGIMGYIEIPSIRCSLPIYHGVDEDVLQIAVGHLEDTSLPVGGEGTHCVLSGHRGLPSARLFTDLDQLEAGDVFMLRILNETLTYEVDQIQIVQPTEMSPLKPVDGEDLCTLVTCTPYGVNSHRLLVRGHRIENLEESAAVRVTSDAVQIEPLFVAPVVAVPLLILLFIRMMLGGHVRKRRKNHRNGEGEKHLQISKKEETIHEE